MSSSGRPLLAELQTEIRGLAADAKEMLRLRFELARLEIQADLASLKRLSIIFGIAAVMAMTALPLLATCLAETLDGWQGIGRCGWLLIFGLILLCLAVIFAYAGWLWFCRRFIGLKETLDELREDVNWAKDWTGAESNRNSRV